MPPPSSSSKNHDYERLLDVEEDGGSVAVVKPIVILEDSASTRDRVARGTPSCGRCLCKCALITFLVVVTITVVVTACVYFYMKDVVEHLTVTDGRTFPVVTMSDTEIDYLQSRVDVFFDELIMKDKEPSQDLIITQDEINGLLCHSDFLRGHIQITLDEGKVLEEYSIPTDMIPGGRGRYFLGHDYTLLNTRTNYIEMKMETAAKHEDWFVGPLYFLKFHYENSEDDNVWKQHLLELYLEEGSTVFGNMIPEDFIKQHKNLLEGVYEDEDSGEDVRAVVNGIESVIVEKGRIVIHPRRHHAAVSSSTEEQEEEWTPTTSAGTTTETAPSLYEYEVQEEDDLVEDGSSEEVEEEVLTAFTRSYDPAGEESEEEEEEEEIRTFPLLPMPISVSSVPAKDTVMTARNIPPAQPKSKNLRATNVYP